MFRSTALLFTTFATLTVAGQTIGASIKCFGDQHTVYRVGENNEIRGYPTPAIATSWDPQWRKHVRIDCSTFKRGPALPNRLGASIKCFGDQHTVYLVVGNNDQIRGYPTPAIATSWDPQWRKHVRIDCSTFKRGPGLPLKGH